MPAGGEFTSVDPRAADAVALWTAAQPAVSAFVHALVGDRDLRDEVLQDTVARILESYGSYDPSRPFLPWALTLARRAAYDARRRRMRFPAPLTEAAQDSLAAAIADVEPAERAAADHLDACLKRLDGRQRQMCELRYRTGLKPARIAELMGLSSNTVSKSLQRIREALRECIERQIRAAATGGPA
jgi:RNA polymerase sigma-70 factor (ECF subfamily)